MPIDTSLRFRIDTLRRTLARVDLIRELEILARRLFEVLATEPDDAPASAAYFSYHLSSEFMRSSNFSEQAALAQDLSTLLRRLYHERHIIDVLYAAPRPRSLALLLRLYNIQHALTLSGLRAAGGPHLLDAFDALRALRIAVAGWGPWRATLSLSGSFTGYHRAVQQGGQARIGWLAPGNVRVELRAATLNLQGVASSATDKFRSIVLPLIRQHHVVTLQEAGVWPLSSRFIADLQVADQFGVAHTVYQRRWEVGSATRPENYTLHYLEVERLRVRLGIVVADNVSVHGVQVIADGVRSPSGARLPRPVLGLRISLPGLAGQVTVYTFHAIANGGSNSPRMLRETVWHSDTPWVMLGDFNRDPREPGPSHPGSGRWASPPEIAELIEADGPTHPSGAPRSLLNYSFAQGLAAPAQLGQVLPAVDSDHRPVSYCFSFAG